MLDLFTVRATNGSQLYLSALTDELEAMTDVPRDVRLGIWHDNSPLFDRENPRQLDGSLGALWPVLIDGASYFVVAGEVDSCGEVRLLFSEPGQEPYGHQSVLVADTRGRRVWMSHPEKMRRRTVVTAMLPNGNGETVIVPPEPS